MKDRPDPSVSAGSSGAPARFYSGFLVTVGSMILGTFLVENLINGYHWWSWFAFSGAGFAAIGARGDRTPYLVLGVALVLLSVLAITAIHVL